jgi:UDP-N-acetyl-D-glucosamine dehydrogenase
VAYKRDVNDMRESPALDILELLAHRGAEMSYTDPFVPQVVQGTHVLKSIPFEAAIAAPADCAVIATDHPSFDYKRIAAMPLVVDTRNALGPFATEAIFRL